MSRHQLTRAGITQLLSLDFSRAAVVEVAAMDGHLGHHDVAVYDLAGFDASTESDLGHLLGSGTPVVAVEPDGRSDLSESALAMGVADVVAMSVSAVELLEALERAAGGFSLDEGARRARAVHQARALAGLSAREAEVLVLIAAGLQNSDIAERLYVSVNTVKTYVRGLYRRIGVPRRPDAVLWAVRHGLGPSHRSSDEPPSS